jgi:dienelactone hydrolase
MRVSTAVLLASLSLTSCSPAAPASTSEPAAATLVPPPAAALEGRSVPRDVDIPGAQGLALRGTWYPPDGGMSPAVLLLHMYGHDRGDWSGLALELQAAGLGALTIDLRGHGQTGGSEDWALAREDVQAAFLWLTSQREIEATRVAVLGASIGANLALWLGAEDPSVAAAVLLSPGFDYFRVEISGLIEQYGARPIFLAASENDGYSSDTVRALAQAASGPMDLVLFPAAGHGTEMLDAEPLLGVRILGFLIGHLDTGP